MQEERSYERDVITGIMTARDMNITWYYDDDTIGATKNTKKYYDAKRGYDANIKARTNIINKASMWVYGDLINEYGWPDGENKAKEFLLDTENEVAAYVKSNIEPLLEAVSASTRTYMTAYRKGVLNTILNIKYP